MTTTSKLNNSIVFSHAIFWGPRADKMGAGDKGQGANVEEHKHPVINTFLSKSIQKTLYKPNKAIMYR